MSTYYTGYIKSFGNAGFIAGVRELKGMVEQANSPEGAIDKLITALKIRISYVDKIDIDKITVTATTKNIVDSPQKNIAEKELNLVLQS
jgi:stage V sporulation protein SpoVS